MQVMKDFISILRRFVPPYKYYLILNIFFNILASVLTLFSFSLRECYMLYYERVY